MHVPPTRMQFLARVSMQSKAFRIILGSGLWHEALSNYLAVDHVAHSKLDASSSPKEKNRTPSGKEYEKVKPNHPVYSSVGQEIAHEDIA